MSGGGNLNLSAQSNHSGVTQADGGSGGVITGSGGVASSSVQPAVKSRIGTGAHTMEINMGGNINVDSSATGDALASTFGVSVAAVGAIGVMDSTAILAPTVDAIVSDHTVLNAGKGIMIRSRHNENGINRAQAYAEAGSAAGLLGAAGANATATNDPRVRTVVGGTFSTLTAPDGTRIIAEASNQAEADRGTGFAGAGGVALGITNSLATATGETLAEVAPSTHIKGGAVDVIADATDVPRANAVAASGGILAAGHGSQAEANTAPVVLAKLGAKAKIPIHSRCGLVRALFPLRKQTPPPREFRFRCWQREGRPIPTSAKPLR